MSTLNSPLWKRVDVVGDIAIVRAPFDYDSNKLMEFASVLQSKLKVNSVWARRPETRGDFRISDYLYLLGERRSETIYREHGCQYLVDFRKVFFSPKLSYEHRRIANLVRKGEVIINMVSGYGPFSILSFKVGRPTVVYSFDVNPWAYYYMMVNIELNRAWGVIPIYGDVFNKIYALDKVDRVIAPLPERAQESYEVALQVLKPGGCLHLFTEVEVNKSESPLHRVKSLYRGTIFSRVVRSAGPRRYHVVVDIKV
jgi:tRNA (guanine37-N1)-methyltransferase